MFFSPFDLSSPFPSSVSFSGWAADSFSFPLVTSPNVHLTMESLGRRFFPFSRPSLTIELAPCWRPFSSLTLRGVAWGRDYRIWDFRWVSDFPSFPRVSEPRSFSVGLPSLLFASFFLFTNFLFQQFWLCDLSSPLKSPSCAVPCCVDLREWHDYAVAPLLFFVWAPILDVRFRLISIVTTRSFSLRDSRLGFVLSEYEKQFLFPFSCLF